MVSRMLVDINIPQIEENTHRSQQCSCPSPGSFDDILVWNEIVYLTLGDQMSDIVSAETFMKIGVSC